MQLSVCNLRNMAKNACDNYKLVKCPFHIKDERGEITCEGIIENTFATVHINPKRKPKYMEEHCCSYGYSACPIYLAVAKKYDDESK